MTRSLFLIFIFFLLPGFFISQPVTAAEEVAETQASLSRRYDEAKFYYNELHNSQSLAKSRENWLKGTRNFRRIYLSSPTSDLAPSCLFMLGRLYEDMYDRFKLGIDLQESISYFKDTARLFPQNRLADDAYFALGQSHLEKRNEPAQAAKYLTEIVTRHPRGDMAPAAEKLLKILSQEYEIPLPKIMVSSSRDNKLSYVLPVKYWSSDNYTRVVIMASGPVNYKEELLKASGKNPRRLYIDFQKSYIEPQYRAPVPIEDGLLRRIRTGQFSPDTVRVVLDMDSVGSYKIFSLPDPFRVVIDVRGEVTEPVKRISLVATKQKRFFQLNKTRSSHPDVIDLVASARKTKFQPSTGDEARIDRVKEVDGEKPLSLAQQLGLGVRKIVLDPGHGGKDPGAMAFGLKEKTIVLDLAKRLSPILQKELGCEVILTRDSDTFVPLEERTAIANTQNADLFVSLHINAHPSPKVRGLETYYLNLSTNAEAMRVAARENATSTHQMSDLQDILSDIMKNSKINESSRLAQVVHGKVYKEIQKKGFADMKNLGVKQAPFYVLIGAQMPAILIEIAFISNEQDKQNLQDPTFLNLLAHEIANGIGTYIRNTTAQFDMGYLETPSPASPLPIQQ